MSALFSEFGEAQQPDGVRALGLDHVYYFRPVRVWVDIDAGIADMVEYLNAIPGVRIRSSCQGVSLDARKPYCHGTFPHAPYILISCPDAQTFEYLSKEFQIETGLIGAPNGEPAAGELGPNEYLLRPIGDDDHRDSGGDGGLHRRVGDRYGSCGVGYDAIHQVPLYLGGE